MRVGTSPLQAWVSGPEAGQSEILRSAAFTWVMCVSEDRRSAVRLVWSCCFSLVAAEMASVDWRIWLENSF